MENTDIKNNIKKEINECRDKYEKTGIFTPPLLLKKSLKKHLSINIDDDGASDKILEEVKEGIYPKNFTPKYKGIIVNDEYLDSLDIYKEVQCLELSRNRDGFYDDW